MKKTYANTTVPIRSNKSTEQPGLSLQEIEDLKDAFSLFDLNNDGHVDPKEILKAMDAVGSDQQNPAIYQLIQQFEKYNKPLEFDIFLQAIVDCLCKTQTQEQVDKLFNIINPGGETITNENLQKIASELGEALTEAEITEIVSRASKDGKAITKEEFFNIMSKQ